MNRKGCWFGLFSKQEQAVSHPKAFLSEEFIVTSSHLGPCQALKLVSLFCYSVKRVVTPGMKKCLGQIWVPGKLWNLIRLKTNVHK